ncbi:MAG TPA: cytochrome P460 family protein [Terracidiphilus sp.]
MKATLVLAGVIVLCLTGCSGSRNSPGKFNDASVLSGELPYNPLRWNVVTSAVSRRAGTLYTVFGNDRTVAHARRGAEGNYPVGAVVSLVTWTQRPDPRWFGGMIPGAVKSVEFLSVVYDGEQHLEYVYAEYSGSPLRVLSSETERLPTGRAAYLLAQRGAFLP